MPAIKIASVFISAKLLECLASRDAELMLVLNSVFFEPPGELEEEWKASKAATSEFQKCAPNT